MDAQHGHNCMIDHPIDHGWTRMETFIWQKDFACDADHFWFIMETNESLRILWSRRASSDGYSILYVKWNWNNLNLEWNKM